MFKWKKFDLIYANGSSVTAGGGLEWEDIRREYKEQYSLKWDNEKDVTYPKVVADYFKCGLIQDAQSGSGAPRLIRRVYEFIEKNGLEVARKTLFLLQISDPMNRLDVYCDKIEDHLIVNVGYDEDGKIEFVSPKEKISPTDRKYEFEYFKGEIQNELTNYVEKYHDPIVYTNKIASELIGLFSFLEQNDIEYFYMLENGTLQTPFLESYNKILTKKLDVEITQDVYCADIAKFCELKKLTIKDELKGYTEDTHPGYFGNQEYGKLLSKLIESKLKPTLYVFGDSFTQTFKNHNEGRSEWAKKYFKYKNDIPKSYTEIIAENYDIQLINRGAGGSCNDNIFETLINLPHIIKPQDIIIVNWTSMSRFRVANELNNFANVIPFANHPSQNEDMSLQTVEEMGINRQSYSINWKVLTNYMNIIKGLYPDNQIYFWTWEEPMKFSERPKKLWNQGMLDNRNIINFTGWETATEETKTFFYENSDLIIDARKKSSVLNINSLIDKGLKIVLINQEKVDGDDFEIVQALESLPKSWYIDYDYVKESYDLMLPYKKYETIYEETKGLVIDQHYSENGHIELANDIIKLIDKKFEPLEITNDLLNLNWIIKYDFQGWGVKNFIKYKEAEIIKKEPTHKSKKTLI